MIHDPNDILHENILDIRDVKWYNELFLKIGMEKFNKGYYKQRNSLLTKMIILTRPKKIFEFAAGGCDLADQILKSCSIICYIWSDFSFVAVDYAKKYIKDDRFKVINIDISKEHKNINWQKYDTVICVSPEHIENDLDILDDIIQETNIFLSCPKFGGISHIRFYPNDESIRRRYSKMMEIKNIIDIPLARKFIVWGIKK